MTATKTCDCCEQRFNQKPNRPSQRFCSAPCARKKRGQYRAVLKCVRCGDDFSITRRRELNKKFCGVPCLRAHEAENGRPAAQIDPVEFSCKTCGGAFFYKPAYLTAYRKKFGFDPLYCGIPCSAKGRQEDTAKRSVFVCEECGKTSPMSRYSGAGRSVYYREQRFCDQTCKSNHQRTRALRAFNEAVAGTGTFNTHLKRHGYVAVAIPSGVTGKKHYVLQHRFVMQQHLGRDLLPEETVHHINGVRHDNRLENLELFSSRHGPGQRVVDKVSFAIEMLRLYPDFAAEAGVKLVEVVGGEHD